MKNLLVIIFLLFSLSGYSQIEYPRYEIDSLGQKVVVLTVQQAQALDNNTDLLVLFEKLNGQIGEYDNVCLKVIADKDKVIASQTVEINKLKESLQNKDDQIIKLQKEIGACNGKIISLEETIKNKDSEINLHLDEIKKVRRKSLAYGGVGGAIVGFIIGILIMK